MAFFWTLTVVIALHIAVLMNVNLKIPPNESPPKSVIEISLITKSAPIKAKQNDNVVAESKQIYDVPPVEIVPEKMPVKKVEKQIEKPIVKAAEQLIVQKKETPKSKIFTTQKSDVAIVEKTVKPAKIAKEETPKKIVELPIEKPRLSLESLQQQISQVGTEVRQQQVNVRDKYINDFSVKVKRIGQKIYDRGELPAGILETKIEISADGSLTNFKITRSSGNSKLDAAVENMVRSSAPYPDFPFQLQNESNSLSFTRVWEFYGD